MGWVEDAAAGAGHLQTEWRPPASPETVAACEEALGRKLPSPFRRLLLSHHDGGILLYDTTFRNPRDNSGLHIFGAGPDHHGRTLVTQTEYLWDCHGDNMRGLVGLGHTPGASAFYLAMDRRGRVIDLFGLPNRAPANPTPFESYRGEWRIIANNLGELVTRMLQEAGSAPDPFYWFRA